MRQIKTICSFTSDSLDERVNHESVRLQAAGLRVLAIQVQGGLFKAATILYENPVAEKQQQTSIKYEWLVAVLKVLPILMAAVIFYLSLHAKTLPAGAMLTSGLLIGLLICAAVIIETMLVVLPAWGVGIASLLVATSFWLLAQHINMVQQHIWWLPVGVVVAVVIFALVAEVIERCRQLLESVLKRYFK